MASKAERRAAIKAKNAEQQIGDLESKKQAMIGRKLGRHELRDILSSQRTKEYRAKRYLKKTGVSA